MFVISVLLMIVSTLMYYIEHEAQPKVFKNVFDAMWWTIVTLTTVGYGDIYPITPLGKILGAIVAILGIGMFALPAGILASGFLEEIQKRRKKGRGYCLSSLWEKHRNISGLVTLTIIFITPYLFGFLR